MTLLPCGSAYLRGSTDIVGKIFAAGREIRSDSDTIINESLTKYLWNTHEDNKNSICVILPSIVCQLFGLGASTVALLDSVDHVLCSGSDTPVSTGVEVDEKLCAYDQRRRLAATRCSHEVEMVLMKSLMLLARKLSSVAYN